MHDFFFNSGPHFENRGPLCVNFLNSGLHFENCGPLRVNFFKIL